MICETTFGFFLDPSIFGRYYYGDGYGKEGRATSRGNDRGPDISIYGYDHTRGVYDLVRQTTRVDYRRYNGGG